MRSRCCCWITVVFVLCLPAMAQVPSLAGRWSWGDRGEIADIRADGTGQDAHGNTVQWSVRNVSARVYVLRWSHGFTETVTLAPDGMSLAGSNQHGYRFSATRISATANPSQPDPSAPAGRQTLIGEWLWGADGGVTVIRQDGTGRDARGNTMQWILRDPQSRTYELLWINGNTDTATLSFDGNSLYLVSNKGSRLTAARRGSAGARSLDLNGSWGKGALHVWQDGTDVLVTATWKKADGKYAIWRGEGSLKGNVLELRIRYSPMTHGPESEWQGRLTVSDDGNALNAVYSVNGAQRETQVYYRDR